MQCKTCGKELKEGTITCPICGTPTIDKKELEEHNINNKNTIDESRENNGIALAGLLFAFFFGIFGLIISIIGFIKSKKVNNDGRNLALFGIIISVLNIIIVSVTVYEMIDLRNNEEHRIKYCENFENKQDICRLKDDGKYDCIFATCEFNKTK